MIQLIPGSLHAPPAWPDAVLPEERENWQKATEDYWVVQAHSSSNGALLTIEQATHVITRPVTAWRAIYNALKKRYGQEGALATLSCPQCQAIIDVMLSDEELREACRRLAV